MPRPKPQHRPTFTAEQLALAHQMARKRSAPLRTIQRARLTIAVAQDPALTHAEAAAQAGIARDTAYKWRRRWAEGGWSLEDAPRSGRPRSFSPGAERRRQATGL